MLPIASTVVALQPVAASVVINEFVASNRTVVADEDGDFEDWLELYNTGNSAIDLTGYGLTDASSDPYRWVFPSVTIEPGSFIIIWASGKDRRELGSPLHANFEISAQGEELILTQPNGSPADTVPAIPMGGDFSRGRSPDGSGTWVYFDEPTPAGSNNTDTFTEWLAPPTFSHTGGFYEETISLQLTTSEPGATILYTLDGTEPRVEDLSGRTYRYRRHGSSAMQTQTLTTNTYGEPLSLGPRTGEPERLSRIKTTEMHGSQAPTSASFKGHTVRARVVKDGSLPSDVVTHSYFITPSGDQRYSLPVVSVTAPEDRFFSYDNGIYVPGIVWDESPKVDPTWRSPANYNQNGDAWEAPGHIELFIPGAGRVIGQDVGFRTHGNFSVTFEVKSLRIYARRDFGSDGEIEYPLFDDLRDIYGRPVTDFKRLILRGSGNDSPHSRYKDAFLQTLLRPIGIDDQRHLPVIHFINGDFWGHMNLRERVDRFYIAGRYLIDPDDVAILNLGTDNLGNYQGAMLAEGTEADLQEFNDLMAFIMENDMANSDNFAYVADRIDIDNFILYQVGEIYVGNTDWPHNNHFFWRKKTADRLPGAPEAYDGRWRWVFVDLDFGFGIYGSNERSNTLQHATRSEGSDQSSTNRARATRLLRRLLGNPEFEARFINAFADHLNTTFQPDRATALIDAFEAQIGPYRNGEHRARWTRQEGGHPHFRGFAQNRPERVWGHIRDHFDLGAPVPVTFNVSNTSRGSLLVNTVQIDSSTPGLPNPESPFPFTGDYFTGHPVHVTALPKDGYRFVGWDEFPNHNDPTITVTPATGLTVTARFAPGARAAVAAYWNFNNPSQILELSYFGHEAASLTASLGPTSVVTNDDGSGFSSENALWGEPAGRHLRVNNPIGTTLTWHLPTTRFSAPRVSFEIRRSGQGPGVQRIEYSLDGITFHDFARIQLFDDDPITHQLDFTELEGAGDNPNFRLRFSFEAGEGGTAGNVRIDNMVLRGLPTGTQTIFSESASIDLGYGWKWNLMGYLYDRFYPFVYSYTLESWIYVIGESEWNYYFWHYSANHWGWTSVHHYPDYIVIE